MGWNDTNVFQVLVVTGSAGSGVFVYSPHPGNGNLISTITAAPGTDPFGNAYLAGLTDYKQITPTNFQASQQSGAATSFWKAASAGGPWSLVFTIAMQPDEVGVAFLSAVNGNEVVMGEAAAALQVTAGGAQVLAGGLSVAGGITGDTEALSAGVAGGNVFSVTNTTGGGASALAQLICAALGDLFLSMRVSGDTNARLIFDTTPGGNLRMRWGSGAAAPDIQLVRAAANNLELTGADFAIDTVGRGLQVKEGTNAKQGQATLVAGTVTVANTSVTASSRIFLSGQNAIVGAVGELTVTTITPGTSFVILSSSNTDTRVINYQIFEPAP